MSFVRLGFDGCGNWELYQHHCVENYDRFHGNFWWNSTEPPTLEARNGGISVRPPGMYAVNFEYKGLEYNGVACYGGQLPPAPISI